MSAQWLTPPFLVGALVLGIAGIAKLRRPLSARNAVAALGLPAPGMLVRLAAVAELGVGGWCLVAPGRGAALALGGAYVGLAAVAGALASQRAGCGCFGDSDAPASTVQVVLSAVCATVAFGAAAAGEHGVGWVLARGPATAAVLALGLASAAFGTVTVYSELPRAWMSWSGR